MGYSINFDVEELYNNIKKVASDAEINKINKNIVKKCGKLVQNKAESKAPKSKDPWKSGKKGSKTGKHMADEIPLSPVKEKNGQIYILVGWDKGNNSPYFYAKFVEYGWGTSKNKPRLFLEESLKEESKNFSDIATKEYSDLLSQLGG